MTPMPQTYHVIAKVRAFLHPQISKQNLDNIVKLFVKTNIIQQSMCANRLAELGPNEVYSGVMVPFIQAYYEKFRSDNINNEVLDSIMLAENCQYACDIIQHLASAEHVQSFDDVENVETLRN